MANDKNENVRMKGPQRRLLRAQLNRLERDAKAGAGKLIGDQEKNLHARLICSAYSTQLQGGSPAPVVSGFLGAGKLIPANDR